MNTSQQHRLIGQVIADRYRIEELLGEGGMGAVYMATHLTLHKQVALKVVHPEHAGNAELAARFAREAMATSRIDHPNVISAMDFGTLADGTAYLAVQLVRGPSLSRILQAEGKLLWPRAAQIGSQIADALSAAHGHGIVHRDLKPDNVLLQLLDDGGELVKVLDFGVAKFARESIAPSSVRAEGQVTQIGIIIGTPGYMAPEQVIGNPADQRSDLYALGVILWEAVAGKPLWFEPDLQRLAERQLSETPMRLREAAGDASIPELFEQLVADLLARRAEDRPSDATLVREQLRQIAQFDDAEAPRWRSGARRVARTPAPFSLEAPIVSPSANEPTERSPAGRLELEASLAAAPTGASLPTRKTARSARSAWLLTVVVTTILGAAVFLVVTGQLVVSPQGQVAEVAETVAKQLNLPSPKLGSVDEKSGLPRGLVPVFERLIVAEERDDRVEAANAMLSHVPADDIPAYVRRMAYLQLAKTCAEKRDEIEQLAKIDDPRALPLLIRISQKPRGGCGKRKRDDCLACLRKPLEHLIDELERKQSESASEH